MKRLVDVLIILAVVALLAGTAARFLFGGTLLGSQAVAYWRGSIGFLVFAGILILRPIRDK